MVTKIIFLPPNSSSYSCQRCLVLNKSNNALPNFDKEPAHDDDGDVVDVGNFPILGEFWKCQRWDICLPLLFWMTGCHNDKGLTKLTKWTTILQKKLTIQAQKNTKLSTELWSGFVVLFSEVSIQQLQSLTGDQTEINADFQQTEGNSFISLKKRERKNYRYCHWSNQNFGNLHSLESITGSQNFQIEYFDENIDDSLKTMTKSWLR